MLTGLGAFITAVETNAQTALILPLVIAGIIVGAIKYMTGEHQDGLRWVKNALIGGAIGELAFTIGAAVVAAAGH